MNQEHQPSTSNTPLDHDVARCILPVSERDNKEAILTVTQLKKRLNVGHGVVLAAMKRLVADGKVAKFATYRHGNGQIFPLLTGAQALLVRDDLADHGQFDPPPPEGYLPVMGIASELTVDDRIVSQAIREIQEQQATQDEPIIQGKLHKNKSILATYYSPEEQRLIKRHLIESGRVLPMATQGHWSALMVRRRLGVSRQWLDELNIKPGKYRVLSRDGVTVRKEERFSPEQVMEIQERWKEYISETEDEQHGKEV